MGAGWGKPSWVSQGQEMRSGEDLAKENLPQKTSLWRQGEREGRTTFRNPHERDLYLKKKNTHKHNTVISHHMSEMALKTIKFFIPTAWMGKPRTKKHEGPAWVLWQSMAEPSLESRTSASNSVYPSPTFAWLACGSTLLEKRTRDTDATERCWES